MLARPRIVDPLAAALVAWTLVEPWALDTEDPGREMALGMAVALPLLARRRAPAAAGTATLLAILLQHSAGAGGPPLHAPAAAALLAGHELGGVAARRTWHGASAVAGFLAAAMLLALLGAGGWADATAQTLMTFAGVVLGGFAIGFFPPRRALVAAQLREEVRDLEHRLIADVRTAADAERASIARALERLVADVARGTRSLRDPAQDRDHATAVLKDTQQAAHDAIVELRELLGAIGRPAAASPPAPPRRASLLARIARFHQQYGPIVAFVAIGVIDQLLLPARPTEIAPGVLVPAAPYPLAVALALAVVTALPLALRDRAPLLAIAAISALLVGRTAVGDLSSLTWSQNAIGVGLAFLAGAFAIRTGRSLAGFAIAAAATASTWALEQAPITSFEWVYLGALLTGAWLGGRRMSGHLAAASRSDDELTALRARREQLEAEAAQLERSLVAREIHDLVGHGLSLMSIHAAVSAARLERGTEELEVAVQRVRELAAETENELAELLGSLRAPRTDRRRSGELQLDDLARLVADARRHGQPVVLEGGDLRVPAGVARAVFEVAREGLTNARKHAGPALTKVAVTADPDTDTVRLEVVNEAGTPLVGAGTQSGIASLRDRVRRLGGDLEAGPAPDGGWRLAAVLPRSGS